MHAQAGLLDVLTVLFAEYGIFIFYAGNLLFDALFIQFSSLPAKKITWKFVVTFQYAEAVQAGAVEIHNLLDLFGLPMVVSVASATV